MTQHDLADAAGVDLKTVYNLESGTRWPIARTRVAISAALRWSGDALAEMARPGRPDGEWRPEARPGGGFTAAEVVAAEPLKDGIRERFDALAADGDPAPSGQAMFPGSLPLAAAWDAARLGAGPDQDPEQAMWAVAVVQVRLGAAAEDRAPRRGSAGALAPA